MEHSPSEYFDKAKYYLMSAMIILCAIFPSKWKKSFRLHDSNVYHNKKVVLEIVILNICSNKSNESNHCKFKRKQEFI